MIYHIDIDNDHLRSLIDQKKIGSGGNVKLKIYGTLQCKTGKRMKKANRVFFNSAEEALRNGFRPCAHCMNAEYRSWKNGVV